MRINFGEAQFYSKASLVWVQAIVSVLLGFGSTSLAAQRCEEVVFALEQKIFTDLGSAEENYPEIEERYREVQDILVRHPLAQGQPLLSIVIPAYKEQDRLPPTILKIKSFFDKYEFPVEVILSIQKSPDQTLARAQETVGEDARFRILDKPSSPEEGKGGTVRYGMRHTRGRYVMFMDADLATPLPEVLNFLVHMDQNPKTAVAIGDRASQRREGRSAIRAIFSYGFNFLVRSGSLKDLHDTQCGFKFFTKEAADQIFSIQVINRFAFDVELLTIADQLGYDIQAIPVRWTDAAGSTVNRLWDPVKMAIDTLKIRFIVQRNIERYQRQEDLHPFDPVIYANTR